MKNKFALCFRPIETVEKQEDEKAKIHKRRIIIPSLSHDVVINHTVSAPLPSSFRHHHDDLPPPPRRNTSSGRKTISAAFKSLLFRSSPRIALMVPKGTKEEGDDHMGIDKKIKEKETKKTLLISNTCSNSLISSSSSSSSSSTYFTSPPSTSTSNSSSMNSLEMNNNFKAISLKRSLLARSNSISTHHNKKLKTNSTKAKDKLALKSSSQKQEEGFVFYLLLLALVLYLLCGFFYAIMLTTLSLYFIGIHRRRQNLVEEEVVDAVKLLSEVEKSMKTKGSK